MISNHSVELNLDCQDQCILAKECVSYNIGPMINNKMACELSNSDHLQHPEDLKPRKDSFSETQGQIVGARESLNGRENKARRKVKNGEKSPWGQCLTRPVRNGRRRSGF